MKVPLLIKPFNNLMPWIGLSFSNNTGKFKIAKLLHFIISLFCFNLFILSQFYELYKIRSDDFSKIVEILGVALLYTVVSVKCITGKTKSIADMLEQIQSTEDTLISSNKSDLIDIHMKYVSQVKKLVKFSKYVAIATIFPYYFNPIIKEWQNPPVVFFDILNGTAVYRPRPLPFRSWFPFDRYKYYYVSYGVHVWAVTVGTSYTLFCGFLFFSLIMFGIVQLKVLQKMIKNLSLLKGSRKSEIALRRDVKKCVYFHQNIIRYVNIYYYF